MPRQRRQLGLPGLPPRVPRKRQRRSGHLIDAGVDGYRKYACERCGEAFVVWASEQEDARDRLIVTRPCPDCDPAPTAPEPQ